MKKIALLIFCYVSLSCCVDKKFILEVEIAKTFQGPVIIVDCHDDSVDSKSSEKIIVDSLGLKTVRVSSQVEGYDVRVLDPDNHKIEFGSNDYASLTSDNEKKLVFNLGEVKVTGYCEGKDISYIYFYVGTVDNFKSFTEEHGGYELDFLEKNGVDFCSYIHDCSR